MLHRVAWYLMYSALLLPSFACAEQSFYQVVDPDGRVRTIRVPYESGQGAEKANPAAIADDKQPDKASEPSTPPVEKKLPEKFAPYDSDTYLDSERLESLKFNPEKKSKFYIVNDGFGSHVEQSEAEETDKLEARMVPQSAVAKGIDLPMEGREINEVASMKALLASNTLCIAPESLGKSRSLAKGRFDTLILDKKALQYRKPLGVVEVYKLSGDGMKTLTVRSYARSERASDFVSPVLAMADDKGCIKRVVTGYFQSRYAATKAKHSMLEGEVTIHADEPYVLVISSEYQSPAGTSYKQSPYGQLSIKWQP